MITEEHGAEFSGMLAELEKLTAAKSPDAGTAARVIADFMEELGLGLRADLFGLHARVAGPSVCGWTWFASRKGRAYKFAVKMRPAHLSMVSGVSLWTANRYGHGKTLLYTLYLHTPVFSPGDGCAAALDCPKTDTQSWALGEFTLFLAAVRKNRTKRVRPNPLGFFAKNQNFWSWPVRPGWVVPK